MDIKKSLDDHFEGTVYLIIGMEVGDRHGVMNLASKGVSDPRVLEVGVRKYRVMNLFLVWPN